MSKSLDLIRNITPFSGGMPTYHIRPQLPVVQHSFTSLLQSCCHIRHLHTSYASQLECLYVAKGFLQFNDTCLNAITFLSEGLEVVNLCYDQFVTYSAISMLGGEDI